MSDRGWVAISRDIFRDGDFKPEPFTEREAFMWLIMEAAHAQCAVQTSTGRGYRKIQLERGQVCHAYSYMAEAWRWSYKRVRGFLRSREELGQIGRASGRDMGTDRVLISIMNYGAWQFSQEHGGTLPNVAGAALGQTSGTHRATKTTTITTKQDNTRSRGSRSDAPEGFAEWYATYPRKKAPKDAIKAFSKALKAGEISLPDLMAKTKLHAAAWAARPKADLQYCPYPASWLNAGEYLDDAPAAQNGGAMKISEPAARDPRTFTESDWRDRLAVLKTDGGRWIEQYWGPPPGAAGCLVPENLIGEMQQ